MTTPDPRRDDPEGADAFTAMAEVACTHCEGSAELRRQPDGAWTATFEHAPSCPIERN